MGSLNAIAVLFVCVACAMGQDLTCKFGSYKIIPKPDCKGYFMCVFGRPVEMPDCPSGSAFSTSAHVCVPENSIYNDCQKGAAVPVTVVVPPPGMPILPDAGPLSIQEQCRIHGGIIPHPTECQAFYNCSHQYQDVPRLFEQHLQECDYPNLFNPDTKQCEHFENVKCGNRKEFQNACDYRRYQCPVAHCIPCSVRFSKCEGHSNGQHAHQGKPWSPYYVMCYKGRMLSEDTCPSDNSGRPQLFHPVLNQCVPLEQIPQEYGGMMPDCSSKSDGFYSHEFGQCDRYNYCVGGKFINSIKCKDGAVFDQYYGDCLPAEKACGPCGKRNDC